MEIFSSKPQQMKLHKDADQSKKDLATTFTCLNNVETCEKFALKLKQDLQEDSQQTFANALPNQKSKLESCLSDVEATARSFRDLLQAGVVRVWQVLGTPRHRPIIDALLASPYTTYSRGGNSGV
eukprot:m.678093 g.678093  ORF g.678093 m.678093 type:complete len:125 (-) comp58577_c0_seq25:377-751(-)